MDQDQVSIHEEVELIFGSTFGLTLMPYVDGLSFGSKFVAL